LASTSTPEQQLRADEDFARTLAAMDEYRGTVGYAVGYGIFSFFFGSQHGVTEELFFLGSCVISFLFTSSLTSTLF